MLAVRHTCIKTGARYAIFSGDGEYIFLYGAQPHFLEKRRVRDLSLVQSYPLQGSIDYWAVAPVAKCFAIQVAQHVRVFFGDEADIAVTFRVSQRIGGFEFSCDDLASKQLLLAVIDHWGEAVNIFEVHSNKYHKIPRLKYPRAAAFSPDGTLLVIIFGDTMGIVGMEHLRQELRLNATKDEPLRFLNVRHVDLLAPGEAYIVDKVSFSADSSRVLLHHSNGDLSVWRISDTQRVAHRTGLEADAASFLGREGRFVSAGTTRDEHPAVLVWDTQANTVTKALLVEGKAAHVNFAASRKGDSMFSAYFGDPDQLPMITAIKHTPAPDDDFDPDVAFADMKSAVKRS